MAQSLLVILLSHAGEQMDSFAERVRSQYHTPTDAPIDELIEDSRKAPKRNDTP